MTIGGFGAFHTQLSGSFGCAFVPFVGITNIFIYIGDIIFEGLILSKYTKERHMYFANYRIYTFMFAVSG